ncbi:MAG: hypothetical protein GY820_42465 [Gammaproteobacteria bacterium]|nr:hypothetical protein [Gammaproteobacteria bacterium]
MVELQGNRGPAVGSLVPPTLAETLALQEKSTMIFDQPYHNNHNFQLVFLDEFLAQGHSHKQCVSCKVCISLQIVATSTNSMINSSTWHKSCYGWLLSRMYRVAPGKVERFLQHAARALCSND